MGLSRLEVNLRRLLAKCELMIKNKQLEDERFPKYVESLSNMVFELEKLTDEQHVSEYARRIQILNNLITCETQPKQNYEDEDVENIPPARNISPREELLGRNDLRSRSVRNTDDLDELLEYNRNMQEKIADDMLILTRNLKEQSQLANKIIKQDTDIVGKSSNLTEKNLAKLHVESEKLQEHSKRAWKCWMWMMLLIVMAVFINMVLFMKVMKKKL